MRLKSQKQLIQTGISRFNAKPKTGIAFLEEHGLIYHDVTSDDVPAEIRVTRPLSLARFLKSSTRLDKKVLGDFLGRPENVEVLREFIGLFNFEDVRYISLRHGDECIMRFTERYRRRHARAVGVVPPSGRITAD